ncbi:T9SS type A sorting domain-containing protein [Balneolales bacterium ANBcel1]|nr:T9SS type A sorting domain-containing protein [Balneolales bacterium ANBcel1]
MKLFVLFFLITTTSADPAYFEQVQTRAELGADIQDVAYGNGVFVAVEREGSGDPPGIYVSEDGRNWSLTHELEDATIQGVTFLEGTFYVFGKWRDVEDMWMPEYSTIWTSANGIGWSEAFSEIVDGNTQFGVMDITYGDGAFVAAINEHLYISTGGIGSFAKVTDSDQFGLQKVAYGNGIFVALNTISRSWAITMAYSTDGMVWTTLPDQPTSDDLQFLNDHFVTLSSSGMSISYDGVAWQDISQGRGTGIAYGNGMYMIPDRGDYTSPTRARYSTDLERNISNIYRIASADPDISRGNIRGVAAGEEGFVLAGDVGIFYAPYEHAGGYPAITGPDIVDLVINQPFEHTVHTIGFNPDRLRTNLEVGVDLPPGVTRNTTSWGVPLTEEAPHISGVPAETGDWPVILYAYEDGLGEMGLYAKRKVVFRVVEPADDDEDEDEQLVLQSPDLLQPEHESIDQGTNVTFTWSPVLHAADYELQISTSASFESLIGLDPAGAEVIASDSPKQAGGLPESAGWMVAKTVEIPDYDTRYYWQVRAAAGDVFSDWSETRSFTTAGPPITATVTPAAPANEMVDAPLPAVIEWNAFDRAGTYDLHVSEASSFEYAYAVYEFDGTRYELPDLKDATAYFWRVRARVDDHVTGWSPVWSFTTELRVPETPYWEPCNGEDNVSLTPLLVWSASDRAETYHLQLSDDVNFNHQVLDMESIEGLEHQVTGELAEGTTYYWRIRAANRSGYSNWSDVRHFTTFMPVASDPEPAPMDFKLYQNYPNPFNPITRIQYSIPEQVRVKLYVYNTLGRRVATLVDDIKPPGIYSEMFDAGNRPSGIYLLHLQAGPHHETLQMTLLK